jgi:YHS domain-containing protein
VEVGNKTCPVTGNPIGSMGPGVKYEYNGKIYNLCCPACRRTFDSDQAKYAQIAENDAARN